MASEQAKQEKAAKEKAAREQAAKEQAERERTAKERAKWEAQPEQKRSEMDELREQERKRKERQAQEDQAAREREETEQLCMARDLATGECAQARIDWPLGIETPPHKSFENQLIAGDSLYILTALNGASGDMICHAPLFNSQRFYSASVRAKETGASFKPMTMQTPMRRNHYG